MAILLYIIGALLAIIGWPLAMFAGIWFTTDTIYQPRIVAEHGFLVWLVGLGLVALGGGLIYLGGYTLSTVLVTLFVAWLLGRGFTSGPRKERAAVDAQRLKARMNRE